MADRVLFSIAEEIVKKLGPLATQEIALWWGVKGQLSKLMRTVTRIKAVLHDAEERVQRPHDQLADWLGKLQEAVYDAEDLLDDFSTEVQRKQLSSRKKISREVRTFFSGSNQFVYGLRMGHKVKELRERLDEIFTESEQFRLEVRYEEKASLTVVREQTTSSEPEIIFGREDDKRKVINFLLSSNDDKESVSVISIVGMGGLGKTTLAQSVFNDGQVNSHFGLKLWASVSGGFDIRKILKDILETAGIRGVSDQLESLKNELKNKIQNRKYLLVLDDVWDNKDGQDGERWDRLKESLLSDARGSKIIVTTRSHIVANLTSTVSHDLKGLSDSESWDLFKERAFHQGEESDHVNNIEEIRREIVERCHGVPLVIKAISRLMSQKDKAQWLPFIKQELPARVQDDNIIQTLKLSYDSLSSYMKHCFAYCSLFPKGRRIDVQSLIQLWIAQGFISSSNSGECLEIVALRCFENLLWRSFFHEAEKDHLGNIQSCRMHDFMHDLATKVASFESVKVDQGGNRIMDLTRHVSFDMKLVLDLSQQIPIPFPCAKRLRTLIFLHYRLNEGVCVSTCQEFRCLRVLDLPFCGNKEVSPLIEKFKHLRYLDLSYNDMEALPNSITNLVNLQVLKLSGCEKLKALPRDINKLINLRHLDVGCSVSGDLCINLECMPCGIGQLSCLQTLSCFVIGSVSKVVGGLDELSILNELRGNLEIRVLGYGRNSCVSEFVGAKLIEKQYLQSLAIKWDNLELEYDTDSDNANDSDIDLYDRMLESLRPHSNLQELWVVGYGGMRFPSWLSHLSKLVRISVENCRSCKHIPPLHEISSLEELSIVGFHNLEYIDNERVGGRGVSMFFPSLKNLWIRKCRRLKGWWKKSSDEEINDDSDESTTTTTTDQQEELMTLSFPCLSFLTISDCPYLTSMPLFPSLDDELWLMRTSSVPLQQTMKMKGWKSPPSSSISSSSSFIPPLSKLKAIQICHLGDMESLPEGGLQNLSSLQRLEIIGCPRLKSLPLPDQGMHSLQMLDISYCRELRSLSESQSQGIPYLPSLQHLIISNCDNVLSGSLSDRLRKGKEAVEYWPYIKHIPNIRIDYDDIQKEGRYVIM